MKRKTITYFNKQDDTKLRTLRAICLEYLDGSDLEHMDNQSLINAHIFLNKKFEELVKLAKTFNISEYSWPFIEIEQNMANFTISESMNTNANETVKTKLTKDVNQGIDQVTMTLGIIQKIMQERNLFN